MKDQKIPQVLSRATLRLLMSIRDETLRNTAIESVSTKAMMGEFDVIEDDDENDPFGLGFNSDDE